MNKTNKKFKDPGSAITHLIAMIGAVICAFPLIGKAVHTNNSIVVFNMDVEGNLKKLMEGQQIGTIVY